MYRRQINYREKKDVEQILRTLCERKEVTILEAEECPDHVYVLVEIPQKYSVSEIIGYLNSKSSFYVI